MEAAHIKTLFKLNKGISVDVFIFMFLKCLLPFLIQCYTQLRQNSQIFQGHINASFIVIERFLLRNDM